MHGRNCDQAFGFGRPRRGAAVMLEVLRSEGCRYVFGNPGTTELALMDALSGAPDISYIWGLQEASVVAMADGYAKRLGPGPASSICTRPAAWATPWGR